MWNAVALAVFAAGLIPVRGAAAEAIALANGGKALQPVVVGEKATGRTRAAAAELADYLGRISGARFEVRTGDGTSGLAVGAAGDFPGVHHGVEFKPDEPFRGDEYLLRTHARGAYLFGATDAAARLAVWDFLHRLGYRLYFLTDTWEVVPERADLRAEIDTIERPDYVTRRAPRGAPWSDEALWERWRQRNGVASSFELSTGHAFDRIIRENAAAFAAHPEYYALVGGQRFAAGRADGRGNSKLCISNPGLRKLAVDWAVREMKKDPGLDSISMDPSDGGGWCECPECAALGSPSDRALTLANDVADAINRLGLGPKYVGLYAYNQHSPPPALRVHPNVVVSVATSFIRGGHTVEELVEGWHAQGAILGIRDYHDVFTWSHDQPRRARGGNLGYLARTIPYFHAQGARFMNSEASDSWGANGLGFWITPRLLWHADQASGIEALVDDFLTHAFGPAKAPMREFYALIDSDRGTPRSGEDLVARLYRCLGEAGKLTDDRRVRARLDDLVLYVRYLELYNAYSAAAGDARQRAFEQVWRHVYRMRDRMMLSTVAICRREVFRDKAVKVPAEAQWSVPEGKNPWKSSQPFAPAEIAGILDAGIKANQPTVLDFEPVEYGGDLVAAASLKHLEPVKPGSCGDAFRGAHKVYTWLPEGGRGIELRVTGGLIEHYRDRGNVDITLHAEQEATPEPVAQDSSVPPDGKERTVSLVSRFGGLHTVEWNDGNDMTRVVFPPDLAWTLRSTAQDRPRLQGRWDLYFYVPRGTKVVGGYSTNTQGTMLDGSGKEVFAFRTLKEAGYFSAPVPAGQDGKLWKFADCTGDRMLMTVPPYLSPSGERLLLPREVVEADGKR